jgi:hypothetical protein
MPNVVTRNIPYGAQVIILFVLAITVLVLVSVLFPTRLLPLPNYTLLS